MIALGVVLGSAALLGYTYVGYPMVCWLRGRRHADEPARTDDRPPTPDQDLPAVSVLIAAWRERDHIAGKLASLAAQDYPSGRLEVIVACDGSDDGTAEVARRAGERCLPDRLRVLELAHRGKPGAINAAAASATGEILVLTDARQALSANAVRALAEALRDPSVGAVGGELALAGDAPVSGYWKYEAWLRRWEARAGDTFALSGALCAIRRGLFRPLPPETILDDVLIPARVRLAGHRVTLAPGARAFDEAVDSRREFPRKVRTLSGNLQILLLEPALLSPARNPFFWSFVSHKLLRLVAPWALVALLVGSALLPPVVALPLVGAQLVGYGVAALHGAGLLRRSRLAALAEAFVVLNAAAVVGTASFVRHGRRLSW